MGSYFSDKFVESVVEHVFADVSLEWDRFASKMRSDPPGFMDSFDKILSRVQANPIIMAQASKQVVPWGKSTERKRGRGASSTGSDKPEWTCSMTKKAAISAGLCLDFLNTNVYCSKGESCRFKHEKESKKKKADHI